MSICCDVRKQYVSYFVCRVYTNCKCSWEISNNLRSCRWNFMDVFGIFYHGERGFAVSLASYTSGTQLLKTLHVCKIVGLRMHCHESKFSVDCVQYLACKLSSWYFKWPLLNLTLNFHRMETKYVHSTLKEWQLLVRCGPSWLTGWFKSTYASHYCRRHSTSLYQS